MTKSVESGPVPADDSGAPRVVLPKPGSRDEFRARMARLRSDRVRDPAAEARLKEWVNSRQLTSSDVALSSAEYTQKGRHDASGSGLSE